MQKNNSFHNQHSVAQNFSYLDTFSHPDFSPQTSPRAKFSAKPFKELQSANSFASDYSSPISLNRPQKFNLSFSSNFKPPSLLDGEDSSDPNRNYKDIDTQNFLAVSAQYLKLSPGALSLN